MDRIAALRAMVAADSDNHFARYGLAHELSKQGRLREALAEFGEILQRNPDYQAAYYHAGKALEQLKETDKARSIYRRGIEASHRNGDLHARSELEEALLSLAD